MLSRIGRLALTASFVLAGCSGNASPGTTPTATTPGPEPIPTSANGAVPDIASVGFGTGIGVGASSCVLAGAASTFPAGATVMMAATFSPVPSSVSITTTKDAVLVQGPATVKPDVLGCVNGRLPSLEAGHYEIVITVPGSEMPPLTGAFDVTP